MNPDSHDLIQRHMAEQLSDDEVACLQKRLKAEPDLRRLYLHHMNLDVALEAEAGARGRVMDLLRAAPMTESKTARRRFFLRSAAVAAVVLVLAELGAMWTRNPDEPLARITETQGARWESSALPTATGSNLSAGRLQLVEGLARLRFARGADVTLEGPAELELIGAQVCRLHRGSLVAHVPEQARGFSVLTPSATLIDHGTDFGVSTDTGGHARVHVMQGEVELRHTRGTTPVRLTTQEMAEITPERVSPVLPLEAEPRKREFGSEADSYTAEITTLEGAGAACYVSEPRTGGNQSGTLLLLKNCAEPGYARKIVLRFDLKSLPQVIHEARLILNLGPTGFGYASQGGAARVGVYALTDDAGDAWTANEVNWSTQPAFHPDAGRVDESKAVRVGEFIVPRGVQTGAFIVESASLKERLQADSNRLLTLLLVRESRIEEKGGLVLGIAGSHHPMLPPPTLRIR